MRGLTVWIKSASTGPKRPNAHRLANASASEDDKRQWLWMAQSWLGLIRTLEHGPDAQAPAKGTSPEE
jgi:hypothetical protein